MFGRKKRGEDREKEAQERAKSCRVHADCCLLDGLISYRVTPRRIKIRSSPRPLIGPCQALQSPTPLSRLRRSLRRTMYSSRISHATGNPFSCLLLYRLLNSPVQSCIDSAFSLIHLPRRVQHPSLHGRMINGNPHHNEVSREQKRSRTKAQRRPRKDGAHTMRASTPYRTLSELQPEEAELPR